MASQDQPIWPYRHRTVWLAFCRLPDCLGCVAVVLLLIYLFG